MSWKDSNSNQTVMSWKDSNLQPGRYERTSSAAQRANFSGLRGERTQYTCARHAVLSNESEMLCGDSTFEHRPADFGLDFPVRKSVHAAPLVPLAVSPRIVVPAGSHRTTFGRGLLRATNEEEPQWARATTGR